MPGGASPSLRWLIRLAGHHADSRRRHSILYYRHLGALGWVQLPPPSRPVGLLLSANMEQADRWGAHHWGRGDPGGCYIWVEGCPGEGAYCYLCRWPLDERHKTDTLILALPLVHAELREILPLPGPQFPTCKVGRSSTCMQGCGGGRQEAGEGQG